MSYSSELPSRQHDIENDLVDAEEESNQLSEYFDNESLKKMVKENSRANYEKLYKEWFFPKMAKLINDYDSWDQATRDKNHMYEHPIPFSLKFRKLHGNYYGEIINHSMNKLPKNKKIYQQYIAFCKIFKLDRTVNFFRGEKYGGEERKRGGKDATRNDKKYLTEDHDFPLNERKTVDEKFDVVQDKMVQFEVTVKDQVSGKAALNIKKGNEITSFNNGTAAITYFLSLSMMYMGQVNKCCLFVFKLKPGDSIFPYVMILDFLKANADKFKTIVPKTDRLNINYPSLNEFGLCPSIFKVTDVGTIDVGSNKYVIATLESTAKSGFGKRRRKRRSKRRSKRKSRRKSRKHRKSRKSKRKRRKSRRKKRRSKR